MENKPTSKHRDFVNIVKLSITFSIETRPKICHEYLCAFVQSYSLALENCLVSEAGKAFYKNIDKGCGGVIGAINAVYKAAVEVL